MLSGVIFDMDGVVADTHPAHIKVWKKLLASIDRKVIRADFEVVRNGKKRDEMLRYFLGDLTCDELEAYGAEKDRLFAEEMPDIEAVAGVRELLGELSAAEIPLGLASSGGGARVRGLLQSLGLSDYFTAVVTGDEVATGKPHPAIFRNAAERLKVPVEELLVFEDAVSGVQGAVAAGMKCFGIAEGCRASALKQAGAERAFRDFSGLSLFRLRKFFGGSRAQPE